MTQYTPKHEFKHEESKSRNPTSSTCPHCGEIALPKYSRDYDMDYMWMSAYECGSCHKTFWLEEICKNE